MTALAFLKIAVYFLLVLAVTKPLGLYMRRERERVRSTFGSRPAYACRDPSQLLGFLSTSFRTS